jgi:hypothetical protein
MWALNGKQRQILLKLWQNNLNEKNTLRRLDSNSPHILLQFCMQISKSKREQTTKPLNLG